MKVMNALVVLSLLASGSAAMAVGGVQVGSGNNTIKCRSLAPDLSGKSGRSMNHFDVEVSIVEGKLVARINGMVYNRDIQVEEYLISPKALQVKAGSEEYDSKLNHGEMRISAMNFYATDKESLEIFGDAVKMDFDLSKVVKVRLYDLDGSSKTNKFGGVVLVEAFDAQGNMLGRLFSSMLPGVCR